MAKKHVDIKKGAHSKPRKARVHAHPSSNKSASPESNTICIKCTPNHQSNISTSRNPSSPIADSPKRPLQPIHESEDPAVTILNIFDKSYELSIATYLNSERITSKHRIIKLSGFKFQPFLAESIKLIARYTEKPLKIIKWIKGEAVLQYSRLTKQNHPHSDVFDDEDWQNIETIVKEWMLAFHLEIREDLCWYFKTTISPVLTESKIIQSLLGGTDSSLNLQITKAPSKVSHPELTITNQV